MSISPVGMLSLTKHRLRNLLIASPNWQTWCGGAAAASDKTYLCEAPPRSPTPHAIINHADNYHQMRDGIRDAAMVQSGDLLLYFCASALATDSNNDVYTDFENHLQAILGDLFQNGNGGHGLVLDSWAFTPGGAPMRVHAEQRDKYGDLIFCEMILTYRMWD